MQRNRFRYAVETYHGDHPKQCISETEREVGFYRNDQWGFACLANEVQYRGHQRRGWPPVPVPLLSSKQSKHRNNNNVNITLQCTIKMHNVAWHGIDVT